MINCGFSWRKINENIDAIIGTRLIIIKAFATSVFAKAKINVMLDPIIKIAFNSPGFPMLIKSETALELKKAK